MYIFFTFILITRELFNTADNNPDCMKVVDWIRLTLNRGQWRFCENVNQHFGSIHS
jgi:hypothetical protein